MNLKKLLLLASIPALALSLPACGSKKASDSNAASDEISAVDLVAEWRADPKAAVKKYNQKQATISGRFFRTVGSPSKKVNYSILLQGKDPANLEFVQVILPDEQSGIIQKLKKDDKLTVTCTLGDNEFVPTCSNPKIELK